MIPDSNDLHYDGHTTTTSTAQLPDSNHTVIHKVEQRNEYISKYECERDKVIILALILTIETMIIFYLSFGN
jgi:hypothetical protein